ncbi:hypothetical protein KSF_033460 [Reticulibacter mediterranei]|uniref:PhoD-like phosphatase metallophosphatase domain-containing protein n=1 Tax=Reticulibacter mediterranei TaxID=2778369 RepID=A0A8J3IIY1_9CHLR|nr:hypothetical protein [Reticulibacter mediterranei]GHO93298.1 hypothetical protein KSF_033460 [Reticulibacter mediterranei]
MSWTPLVDRIAHLPLILSGPVVRRVEPAAATIWLALKEPRRVTLHVYIQDQSGALRLCIEGTGATVRLGDSLHIVAVTARASDKEQELAWGNLYYYDLFFQPVDSNENSVSEATAHLSTPGIITSDVAQDTALQMLTYEGHPLPGFVVPPADINQLSIVHGSCRKMHGDGTEMLSTLDTLLANAAHDLSRRPQQLYMTGDQIYADDVAAPLLFALMDSGRCLCAGNTEEILPIVHAPAWAFGPGSRRDIVHNEALLTTTTPHNHLLSLSEYASMYLYAWSDVLWPEQLPDVATVWQAYPELRPSSDEDQIKVKAQYEQQNRQLQQMREELPQVRRALANIATYMICDDHEITDDWYLDGAWCQQVLSNPLGRHILRNAILTYALFQAWGNTPDQFADLNGSTLLAAIDTWRGQETDKQVALIEEIIGLPAAFDGSGTLQYSRRTLHWHYTYNGAHHRVIVMDTRTRRYYRSPEEFPGLLSHEAMHTQIRNEEWPVTILISATPVMGVDFIESIQFWSRWRVRDNYAYDREAWALEWGTFQHFLKTVSRLKRVVILSGDVHYAFGSSMEYWDYHTGATAKLVNYTSSSLYNEGSGSHMAVLAVGYPRLLHMLRRQQQPTLDFFAWDINDSNHHFLDYMLTIIHKRIYRVWWSLPRLIAARRSPNEIVLPAQGWLKGTFDAFQPDRSYRLRYLSNTLARAGGKRGTHLQVTLSRLGLQPVRLALGIITFLEGILRRLRSSLARKTGELEQAPELLQSPSQTLVHQTVHGTEAIEHQLEKRRNRLVETIFHYGRWLNRWKAGELIVGYNNIGEIRFHWNEVQPEVIQRLWWYRPGDDDDKGLLQTADYCDTLALPTHDMEPPLP